MHITTRSLAVATLAVCATTTHAGRPLATDDAAVADTGTCQIEAWFERAQDDRAIVVAPACGVAKGLELGVEAARDRTQGETTSLFALATKWVPAGGKFESRLGTLNLALKAATARAHGHASAHTVLLLATLEATPCLVVHANLGATRDATLRTNATVLNAALAWAARERTLLFAEALANDRAALFGGTVRTAGARWWLKQDTLGLDLTASRQAGSGSGTRLSVGFGWYGL